jgi:hypothetical protein
MGFHLGKGADSDRRCRSPARISRAPESPPISPGRGGGSSPRALFVCRLFAGLCLQRHQRIGSFQLHYDPALNGIDRAILHGLSVSDVAHGGTVVHQPAMAVGNPGNAMLPASDQSLAERYRSRFFAVMGCFQKTASQGARIPACRTVLPSYSRYAINYSIDVLQGIMVYILDNPPLNNASTGSGSPEAIAFVRLQYPVQTLSFLLRRQNYAPSLQTLA